jgi:uncharacterized protein (DUF58 family)
MLSRELIQKIRRIQIRTTHLVDEMLGGQYHSAFKGAGIEFEEVRQYQFGDDVRSIDWNVTARVGQPFIKLFREEREQVVRLLVDISPSQNLGTQTQTKRELISELAGTLGFAALKNNDKVGLTLFSDRIEGFLPPRKGSQHALRMIRDILLTQPLGSGTDLKTAIEHTHRTCKRRSIVFIASDFLCDGYQSALRMLARRHDVIPVVVSDAREWSMPNVGLIRLRDAETGEVILLDSNSKKNRLAYQSFKQKNQIQRDQFFANLKIAAIDLKTGEDFVEPLKKFFKQREKKRQARGQL